MIVRLAALFAALSSQSAAQFPVRDPNLLNLTVARSPADSSITISYKEPRGACNTAFSQQKQYTGWVHMPGDEPTNLFFWFVQGRQPTDSLTIWLNGGPGSSSLFGFFAGVGPCQVIEKGINRYDTVAEEWGWDRASNMLFIDQPNQVGFSYDTPTDGTLILPEDSMRQPPVQGNDSFPAWAYMNGTFSTMSKDTTANTTENAAVAVWHLVQGFLTTFPQYQPQPNSSIAVNLFAESYGGRYGPIFAEQWEAQNQKRTTGQLDAGSTMEVRLGSLGIVNGCIDQEIQVPFYPVFSNNNTYKFKAISDETEMYYSRRFNAPGECKDKIQQCTVVAMAQDPGRHGNQPEANRLCEAADEACSAIQEPYRNSGRSVYDLAAPWSNPFPPLQFIDYLNQGHVLQTIGSPVNYTMTSNAVFRAFKDTGDLSRGGNIKRLADLLNRGVRIGFMYGDRDYICNWLGGQAVSLAVADQSGPDYARGFPAAGYAPIVVNDSYVGGLVRQYGNLSFSRIYQAGHYVAWYQPETAFQVFARIMMGTSISTGETISLSTFSTTGPRAASHEDKLPAMPSTTCYIRAFADTCDTDAKNLASAGNGTVINGILYSESADWPLAATQPPSSTYGRPTTTTSMLLTGVFTATKMPDNRGEARSPRAGILWITISSFWILQGVEIFF
ncbi:carboxypeptidase S1 [Metarhizium album ARSEF 1941]|uniref:Carboxypeptidase n=1 Tax=Metarhizium album (strain ARSEF 1941) TaxID=1081103 RepID=A0A0B2X890_METAS|nr:carboxypeptidase S1 [Metarhizium album ARSEF 1941]KHO01715.1 carboxypeptidase S1 [Metarhizium album ARSEF 1941]